MKRILAITAATIGIFAGTAPMALAANNQFPQPQPQQNPAPSDSTPIPEKPKGEQCGAKSESSGFAAGVQEIFMGVPNCAVKGTKDLLTGLTDMLNQSSQQNK